MTTPHADLDQSAHDNRRRRSVPRCSLSALADRARAAVIPTLLVGVLLNCSGGETQTLPGPTAGSASQTVPTPTFGSGSQPTPTPQPSATRARTWTQLRWSRPGVITGKDSPAGIASWHNAYVAVGQSTDNGQLVGAAFLSVDGVQWQRTAILPVRLGRPVGTATRLISVVNRPSSPSSAEAWVSVDGRIWQREDRLGLAGAAVTGLVALGPTVVAVGTDVSGRAKSWRSDDGAPWSQAHPIAPRAIVRSVAAVGDGFVALGRDGEPDKVNGGVGVPGVGRPAAWWSGDGLTWSAAQVEGAEAPGAQLNEVFRVKDGYIAIGSDTTTTSGNPRSPLLWISSDARDWSLFGPPPHWGLAATNGQHAVVLTRSTGGTTALEAWVSEDGRQWTQLGFGGDVADVPAFETSLSQPSRVDELFVAPNGIVVLGQRDGHAAAWFADAGL